MVGNPPFWVRVWVSCGSFASFVYGLGRLLELGLNWMWLKFVKSF